MMNTINTEFSSVEVWFTDQSSKALEIEDNVNLALIIGIIIIKMRYSTAPRFRKYALKFMVFCLLLESLEINMGKN